ncbi:hypothetical protein [Pararhodobacter sp.]|uniref:hypothetical protein n=1 Tax=Pararhodobacter sp. TaxID=2127056 RepID=UPI002AFF25F0|nr:hypothetical protein [Pararhodobacter sp.]
MSTPPIRRPYGRILIGVVAVLIFAAAGFWFSGYGRAMMYRMMHAQMHGQMHGAEGMGHDELIMPGLQGVNATADESADLAVMFNNFHTLSRTVEELPNGIRTVTSSSDPDVMGTLATHVFQMIQRVETADDPQIFIQSPTLDIFFERPEAITTEIELTDAGIVVVQTSDDPEMVAALHTHAAEVSDMAARGMQAVHEMMMNR